MSDKEKNKDATSISQGEVKAQNTSLKNLEHLVQGKKKSKGQTYQEVSQHDQNADTACAKSADSECSQDLDKDEGAPVVGVDQYQQIRKKKSLLGEAKWYDRLFFNWTFKIIEFAQTNQLTIEDLGGIRDEDMIQDKIIQIEKIFNAQKSKNIFLAVVSAFKGRFLWAMFGIWSNMTIHMTYPIIVNKIVQFMQDKEEQSFGRAINLILLLVFLNMVMMLIDCHNWYNNLSTGCMAQKIISAMTVKKQLRLTAATSKNYEQGQIQAVRGATHRLIHFCWEINHFVTTPVWLTYCSIRLFQKVGFTYLIGLTMFYLCYRFDKYFHKQLAEEHHEQSKLNEKRMNLTSESFENIKTIKFYGWDEYFKKEILNLRKKEIENGQRISNIYLVLQFVWNFLPNLMSSVCFICYLGLTSERKFELPDVMEMLILFEWIRGALHHALRMREQIADLQICSRRIEDYLAQEEVAADSIVKTAENKSEFAVQISNKSFSWGLQTQDVDEMFDRMHKEMKGLTDEKKSREALREEIENKQKKEAELKKQRKLDNVVCLKNIDLQIKKGQFVCIIGKVGSGKSSLLSAMIGDLLPVPEKILDSYKADHGWEKELNQQEAESFQSDLIHYLGQENKEQDVVVNGSIAYTQQTPWIRNKIVRDNICYNMPFDCDRYVDTITYCELETDLKVLKAGDQTEIGEKGVNLSGGQKARLGLARAVYANKEIYLMDDPISALDAHVRKQIINNVYFGILKDRTRILVTNAIDFLNRADHIVMMEQGKIKAQGSYQELEKLKDFSDLMELNKINKDQIKKEESQSQLSRTLSKTVSSRLMSQKTKSIFETNQDSYGIKTSSDQTTNKHEEVVQHFHDEGEENCKACEKHKQFEEKKRDAVDDDSSELSDNYDPDAEQDNKQALLSKVSSIKLQKKKTVIFPLKLTDSEKQKKLIEFSSVKKEDDGKIIDDDADEKAKIETKTITRLIEYYGHWSPFVFLIAIRIFMTYCYSNQSYMIGQWAEDKAKQTDSNQFWAHVIKIVVVVTFQGLSEVTQQFVMRKLINKTLERVHNDVLQSILDSAVNLFFDVTPNGSIMSRFSEDMNVVEHVVHCFMHCVGISIEIIYMFILICQQNIWAAVVIPLLGGYAKYIWDYTLKAKRQAIQILIRQRGPITTHRGEIMNGCSTIRAFDGEGNAIEQDAENENLHLLAQQVSHATFTWYSTRIMVASSFSTLFSGSLCLLSKYKGGDPIKTAMAFQEVVHLGYRVNGLIHISGDLEKKMASIQKCFKLLDVPHEKKDQKLYTKKDWPTKGNILFNDVELKYRPTTDLVLRKLSFEIKGGEKIGVVGRTGAGKSTITLALTRIIELCGGNIKVDGVNIGEINLQQVRESITIIPQEPTLFKGTLKFNLDPENKRSDEDILDLLGKAGLTELILKKKKEEDEKKKKLDSELTPEQLAQALALKQVEDSSLLNFQVQAGGENLSSGEKSLICICRAILRENKIVILDEATANIDIETEQVIQKLIKESFKNCTMIVVAHRLQTIIESDRVLVLDLGKVAEFDKPSVLRKRPESHFAKLINEIQTEEKEKEEAKKKEKKKENEEKKE